MQGGRPSLGLRTPPASSRNLTITSSSCEKTSHLSSEILVNLCWCTIKPIISNCITGSYDNCTSSIGRHWRWWWKLPNASSVSHCPLLSLSSGRDVYIEHVASLASSLTLSMFVLLPSGRWFRSPESREPVGSGTVPSPQLLSCQTLLLDDTSTNRPTPVTEPQNILLRVPPSYCTYCLCNNTVILEITVSNNIRPTVSILYTF